MLKIHILFIITICLLLLLRQASSTITIAATGKQYVAKPDTKYGLRLSKGLEYMGRLQYIGRNLPLCGSQTWNITAPSDGLPVALFVKRGGCSIEQKARAASTQIYPPGVVKFIIIDGDNSAADYVVQTKNADDAFLPQDYNLLSSSSDDVNMLQQDDDGDDTQEHDDLEGEDDLFEYNDLDPFQVDDEYIFSRDRNNVATSTTTTRSLRRKRRHDVEVAILHVSYSVGYELLDLMTHETQTTLKSGGPKVILDDRAPPTSARIIFLWVMLSALMSATACCCLVFFINRSLWEEQQQQNQQPQQPVRRRLTVNQVRSNFPDFFCTEEQLQEGQIDDSCAICLDEYTPGVRLRQLPCNHVFHGRCIARWLIERHATCPLCKIDLYEEEESSSDEDEDDDVDDGVSSQGSSMRRITEFFRNLQRQEGQQQQVTPPTIQQTGLRSWLRRTRQVPPPTPLPQQQQQQQQLQQPPLDETPTQTTVTTTSWWRRLGYSWGQNIRRRTRQSSTAGPLTELTEPLLTTDEVRAAETQGPPAEASRMGTITTATQPSPAAAAAAAPSDPPAAYNNNSPQEGEPLSSDPSTGVV